MSQKRGLGFNKFTGQRAAGLGFQDEPPTKNTNKGRSTSSQGYSGGVGYSITTYRDKMSQMNDQERIIEEKKRQIEAKLAADLRQKEKEVVAPPPRPVKQSSIKMPDRFKKSSSSASNTEPAKPNLLVNDGNFLERFKQMQQGKAVTPAATDKKKDDSSSDSSKRWFQGSSNPKTWNPAENRTKTQDKPKADDRQRERDRYHHESRLKEERKKSPVRESPMQKQFRERWEAQTGRAERKDAYRDDAEDRGFMRSDRDRGERRGWNRSRSPSPKKSLLLPEDDPSTLALQVQATLESAILQQTVTEAIGMLKAAQTLAGAQLGPPEQPGLGQPQLMQIPGPQPIQHMILQPQGPPGQPGVPGEVIQVQQLAPGQPPPPGSVQVIQQSIHQLLPPASQQILVAQAQPPAMQQTQIPLGQHPPGGPFSTPPPSVQQQLVMTGPPIQTMQNVQIQQGPPRMAQSPQPHIGLVPTPPPASHVQLINQPPGSIMSLAPMSIAPPPQFSQSMPASSVVFTPGPPQPMSMAPPGVVHLQSTASVAVPMSMAPPSISPGPPSQPQMAPNQPVVIQQQFNVPPPETITIQAGLPQGPPRLIDISQPPPQPLPPQNQQFPTSSQAPPFMSQAPVSLTPPPPFVSQAPLGHPLPFASQAPPYTSQAPPLYASQAPMTQSQAPILSYSPQMLNTRPIMTQPPPNMGQPPPPNVIQPPQTHAQPMANMLQPPPNMAQPPPGPRGPQFNAPPPGFLKQEPVDHQEEYTTVMGKYGPVLVKKSEIQLEPHEYGTPARGNEFRPVVKKEIKTEDDYDPAMPTEGDSPAKEMGLGEKKSFKMEQPKEFRCAVNAVSLPENPAAQGMIDSMARYAAAGGDEAVNKLREDANVDSNLWFMSHEDSPEFRYFMAKLNEFRGGVPHGAIKQENGAAGSSAAKKRKRKSRWGPEEEKVEPASNLTHMVTLQEFSQRMVGSDTMDTDQLQQIKEQKELNMMYELIVARKKAHEAALMSEVPGIKVKPKYEYDSDEETDEHGTWEHKNRMQEMMATRDWAEALTDSGRGKHHIGDFMPPEELERFMETFAALKEGRTPDYSDYKEFKITCDNIGFQMLQKLGWNEGEGLGSEAQGITQPVNKGNVSVDGRGVGLERPDGLTKDDDEFDAYRKRMMLAYRFRPNPLNNPRRAYY
ncbi:bromodomain-containing protein 4-like [Mya arenaria]|nr:bromodomain-containing protein 4-like [Mya arenaria]